MHVRMLVFGTVFVFMDEIPELVAAQSGFHSPDSLSGTSVTLHLQVADAQAIWRQAIEARSSSYHSARPSNSGVTIIRAIERSVPGMSGPSPR